MATFPSIKPTYGLRKRSNPSTRVIRFADGYEHRLLFGLAQHQNPKEFSFTYEVSETDADTIENFLDAREGTEAFEWTPPNESYTSKYRCKTWSKTMPYSNLATIKATFEEVVLP